MLLQRSPFQTQSVPCRSAAVHASIPPASAASKHLFRFKHFTVDQQGCSQKVGTDSMLLGAWAPQPALERGAAPVRMLDIGTGTGVLALMMAQKAQEAQTSALIDAIDIDQPSCALARRNADASPWGPRIRVCSLSLQQLVQQLAEPSPTSSGSVHQTESMALDLHQWLVAPGDLQAADSGEGQPHASTTCVTDPYYDIIVSNPPFFQRSTKPQTAASRAAARHADVALPFPDLAAGVASLLRPGPVEDAGSQREPSSESAFYVVLPVDCSEHFIRVADEHGLRLTRQLRVRTRASDAVEKRRLMKFVRKPCGLVQRANRHVAIHPVVEEELVIGFHHVNPSSGAKTQVYTRQYAALTGEFHHPNFFKLL